MTVWRMSMRCGSEGDEMWLKCHRKGVAGISYRPFIGVNLTGYPEGEPVELWEELRKGQIGFFRRVVYDMSKGDIIYVKQGPKIVGRGTVLGSYQFEPDCDIVSDNYPDRPFEHQVPVDWDKDFAPIDILLGSEISTVLRLEGKRLRTLEKAVAKSEQ